MLNGQYLVKSKPVEQEVSRTVILPPMASVLCKMAEVTQNSFYSRNMLPVNEANNWV